MGDQVVIASLKGKSLPTRLSAASKLGSYES